MRDFVGPIRIWWGAGRSLYLGPGFHAQMHRCASEKVCVALDGVLRWTAAQERGEAACCRVPPGHAHTIDAADSRVAIAWFDRGCAHERGHDSLPGIVAQSVTTHERRQLRSLLTTGESHGDVHAFLERLVQLRTPAADTHPSLERVVDILHRRCDERLTLQSLAREVAVSRSWLSHSFSRATGVPLRRYVLWQRLRRACELGLKGWPLGQAAHAAGFADAAHFSRSYRAAFGIAPVRLFELRDRVDVRSWR